MNSLCRARLAVVLWVIFALGVSCRDPGSATGIKKPSQLGIPTRIVSITPHLTEIAFAIGAGDRVVGVTQYCTYPPQARTRAQIGGTVGQSVSLEAIVALAPDLVLAGGYGQEATLSSLRRMGIPVAVHHPGSIESTLRAMVEVGKAVGETHRAEELVNDLRSRLSALESAIRKATGGARPKVFYLLWDDPLLTAGPSTFIAQLIDRAGGRNIFDDIQGDFPRVSLEEVVRRNPEVIVMPSHHGGATPRDALRTRPGWSAVQAIRRPGAVHSIDGDIISRPGPRMVEALTLLATAIHGVSWRQEAEKR